MYTIDETSLQRISKINQALWRKFLGDSPAADASSPS
jgi:hypothetical protein